jgi:formylglycine-generating enzyme required for sulfatase activity
MTYYEGDIPPRRKVILKDFEIDRLEVTVANWRECEKAGVCKPARSGEIGIRPEDRCNAYLPDKENHPVNCVSWEMAKIYCSRKNKRLPSAGEWEYAAFGGNFGGEGRKYPWGNEKPEDGRGCYQPSIDPCYEYEDYKDNCEQAEPDDCCHNRRRTCRVGSYPDGASPFGALDMYGNLWEWTSDRPGELSGEPQETTYVAVAGGSTQDAGITNPFYTMEESGHYLAVGFRCVR